MLSAMHFSSGLFKAFLALAHAHLAFSSYASVNSISCVSPRVRKEWYVTAIPLFGFLLRLTSDTGEPLRLLSS